jgi:hypothetical protein
MVLRFLQHLTKTIQTHTMCLILLCFIISVHSVSAQTMSGGPYTLNGSVGVVTDQGQGGGYSLSPISSNTYTTDLNSSGSSQSGHISQNGPTFGGGEQPNRQLPLNGTTSVPVSQNTRGAYNTYPYNTSAPQNNARFEDMLSTDINLDQDLDIDTVTFGTKTYATSSVSPEDLTPPSNYRLLLSIISIGVLLFALNIWIRFHKNSKNI